MVTSNFNQTVYFSFLTNFRITVIPFQNIDPEKITNDITNTKEVFCKIPKYEIG